MKHQKVMLASSAPKKDLNLWHCRHGHRNKRDILTAVNKDLIMGHSMLLGAVVPMKYWTYTIQYTVYVYNLFPTTTEDGYMAPYEAKYGVIQMWVVSRRGVWVLCTYPH